MACTGCDGGCGSSCKDTCSGGCGSSCEGGCSGGCGSNCTGSCSGECSDNCAVCTSCGSACLPGCTSCSGSCSGGCRGGCKGCGSGCADECTTTCIGGCNDTCTSTCSDDCNNGCKTTCTACTGTCSGGCDNGCTETSMTSVYDALGEDIIMNAIMKAKDVNDIETYLMRELQRRSISYTTPTSVLKGSIIEKTFKTDIDTLAKKGGYTTNESSSNPNSAALMQRYIAFIKKLYKEIIID